jgi:hypothetical protein
MYTCRYVIIDTFNTRDILNSKIQIKLFYYGDIFRYKVPPSGHLYMLCHQELRVELNLV